MPEISIKARARAAIGVMNAPKERFLYLNSIIKYARIRHHTKKISDSYRLVKGTALRNPICPISLNSFHRSPKASVWETNPVTVSAVATIPIGVFLKARYVIYVIIASMYATVDKPKKVELSIYFPPF
jgi:hypothetical protein